MSSPSNRPKSNARASKHQNRVPHFYSKMVANVCNKREKEDFLRIIKEVKERYIPPIPEMVELPASFYESTERANARWNMTATRTALNAQPPPYIQKAKRPVFGLQALDVEINEEIKKVRTMGPRITQRQVHGVLRAHMGYSEQRLRSSKFGGITEVKEDTFQKTTNWILPQISCKQTDPEPRKESMNSAAVCWMPSPIETQTVSSEPQLAEDSGSVALSLPSQNFFHLTSAEDAGVQSSNNNDSSMRHKEALPANFKKIAYELGKDARPKSPFRLESKKQQQQKTSASGSSAHDVEQDFQNILSELKYKTNEIHSQAITYLEKNNDGRREAFSAKEGALDSIMLTESESGESMRSAPLHLLRSVRAYITNLETEKTLRERTEAFNDFFLQLRDHVARNCVGCPYSLPFVDFAFALAVENKFILQQSMLVNYLKDVEGVAYLRHSFQTTVRQITPVFGFTGVRCEALLKERIQQFDPKPLDFLGGGRIHGLVRLKVLMCKGASFNREGSQKSSSGAPKRYTVVLKHGHVEWQTAPRSRPCWGEEFVIPFTTPTEPLEVVLLESEGPMGVSKVALDELYLKGKMIKITLSLTPKGAEVYRMELVMMAEPCPDPYEGQDR